ncbi:MAG: tail fiber domain-containing protein [Chthoniobacterales bacterium]
MRSSRFSLWLATFGAVVATFLALSPMVYAVTPAPDGGYNNANTAEGTNALFSLTSGTNNTAIGNIALFQDTTGSWNTGVGSFALFNNTSGNFNTAVGWRALVANTTGANNIAIGINAGANLNNGNNNNIEIGNNGDSFDFNLIRIGTEGTQHATFIAGINDTVITGAAVCVTSTGQLGECTPSSERFKHNIESMDKASEAIFALRPVTFRYNHDLDPSEGPQFGLVAEEVEKISPDLVRYDSHGKINGVRYDAVNALLLNEFLKEHRKVEQQAVRIAVQEKAIQTLTASVNDQATQIQKVSAELAVMKSKPQLVDNQK